VRALRESLPVSFIGLLLALAVLVAVVEHGTFIERIRASIPPGFAVMSIVLVVVLAVRLAQRLNYPVVPMLVASVVTFGLALPIEARRSFAEFSRILGTSGLFTAIVCCLLVAVAIGLARRRRPDRTGALLGAAGISIGFYILSAMHLSIGALLAQMLLPLGTLGDSFLALFVITGIEAVLWVFGIHGPALLAAIVLPVYLNLQFINSEAALHHAPLPHRIVVSTFLFVFPGGAGATLPLVLLLMRSKLERLRKFGFAVLAPSLLNTNEPVLFGLPLVYNPILGIPFVLAPLALGCTTYAALALNWVRAPAYYVPSTVPVFLNVFLATFDWRAVVLVAVNLVLAGAIYYPFVRIYERSERARVT
jgi:cellobiose-specific phosphotransferase system component IIC